MRSTRRRTLFLLVTLIVSGAVLVSARGNDESYWGAVLDKVKLFYAVKHDHVTGIEEKYSESAEQLRIEVAQRLQDDPTFATVVRNALRRDSRPWVRVFAAAMLIKAFREAGEADYIYMLSDPDVEVRAFGIGAVKVYEIEGAACSLPAGLLSEVAVERLGAMRGIHKLLGGKGLPYYVKGLYDSDANVASEAAKAFKKCNRDDAVPHLVRYLSRYGKASSRRKVTISVINALCKLHGEPFIENSNPKQLRRIVDKWVKRLGNG